MRWLVLGLIGTAALAQDDRPTRRVDDPELQKSIHRAIDRGVAYLKGMQEPDGSYVTASTAFPMRNRSMDAGYTALCLYAMAVSGVKKDDPVLTRGVACPATRCKLGTSRGQHDRA